MQKNSTHFYKFGGSVKLKQTLAHAITKIVSILQSKSDSIIGYYLLPVWGYYSVLYLFMVKMYAYQKSL